MTTKCCLNIIDEVCLGSISVWSLKIIRCAEDQHNLTISSHPTPPPPPLPYIKLYLQFSIYASGFLFISIQIILGNCYTSFGAKLLHNVVILISQPHQGHIIYLPARNPTIFYFRMHPQGWSCHHQPVFLGMGFNFGPTCAQYILSCSIRQ